MSYPCPINIAAGVGAIGPGTDELGPVALAPGAPVARCRADVRPRTNNRRGVFDDSISQLESTVRTLPTPNGPIPNNLLANNLFNVRYIATNDTASISQ